MGDYSYLACAGLTALVPRRMQPTRTPQRPGTIWRDIPVGLRYVTCSPFLRVTLACATGFNVIFAGLTIAVIATQATHGGTAFHLGTALSMGAVGGILGAWAAPSLNRHLSPAALVYSFGWTCCLALALLGQARDIYLIGALLAVMSFVATPANATLFAAQIAITPPELQGRVVSTAMLAAGIAAPAGPPLAGLLIEHTGQTPTFLLAAALAATLTVVLHLSPPVRTWHRPDTDPEPPQRHGDPPTPPSE